LTDDTSPRRRRAWLARLAGLSDSPHRTAAAFAVGVFLSFSPFLGLQIASGVAAALMLRLNRVAVLAGLCANLPWVMVPWYAVTTMLGATILGVPVSDDLMGRLSGLLELPVYRATFWERAGTLFRPFVWPFILGSTLGALVLAVLAYAVVSRLIMRVRQPASP
jgi:uncharacterized protein